MDDWSGASTSRNLLLQAVAAGLATFALWAAVDRDVVLAAEVGMFFGLMQLGLGYGFRSWPSRHRSHGDDL